MVAEAALIADKFRALRKRAGMTLSGLAKAMGYRNGSSIQRYEDPDLYKKKYLSFEICERLAGAIVGLGHPAITKDEVFELAGITHEPTENAIIIGSVGRSKELMPVFGKAQGGPDGAIVLDGNPIDQVSRPMNLLGIVDAYGVLVSGDSMHPRYRDGLDMLHVDPRMRPRKGDFVVVQISQGENEMPIAMVKEYVRQTADGLLLRQLNPEGELKPIPNDTIIAVHVVVGSSNYDGAPTFR